MKYPNIILFRYNQYSDIDTFFKVNRNELLCTINPTDDKQELNELFDANYHLLITFGNHFSEYVKDVNDIIAPRMLRRWLHFDRIENVETFNKSVNYCYIDNVIKGNRPTFSIFTTCYNSYQKIERAYNSVKEQTLKDWEWVILDDTPTDDTYNNHFRFLTELFENDKRVRLYKGADNNGSIGSVKNDVVSLCRGKYVIELDHDDEILPKVLEDSVKVFEDSPDIGFIYMDYTNIYEDGSNYKYNDCFSLGYAGYYLQWYKERWVYVASTPNINNITLGHIVSVPNHPRIWRKNTLIEMGNYSEMLPISDDYELLLRTAVNTKMAKIHKLGYVQYMNNGGNNFSLIRNSEINRLCGEHLKPMCFDAYKINEHMKNNDAFDEGGSPNVSIWKKENFVPKHINKIINADVKKQFAIIKTTMFLQNLEHLKNIYSENVYDFLVLDNEMSHEDLCKMLETHKFHRMKCYSIKDASVQELINYFMFIYKSCDDYEIIS
uniref:Glycosyltransferase 2-like domain-containing protein n=1 Tax=viral metagenome TaxID=1070528 RepID=A0A6C0KFB6_9ZZZZ